MTRGAAALALLLAAAAPARAACPDIPTVARFARTLLEREVPAPFAVTTLDEARCAQNRLVVLLAQPWGDVQGPALAAETLPPLRGMLYFASLRAQSGTTLDVRYAARPAIAPGIVLHIDEDGRATTASPYLALLDLAAVPADGGVLARVAGNLGQRLGVMGEAAALPADAPDALLQADGGVVASLARLGLAASPQDLLAALTQELAAEGRPLRPGTRVALLAAPAPMAPRSGETWQFSVNGLGAVSVTFR